MAAWDTFEGITASLSDQERKLLASIIARARSDLFAARSEEARVRIVHEFSREVHTALKQGRHS
jgi:hypothetical protein